MRHPLSQPKVSRQEAAVLRQRALTAVDRGQILNLTHLQHGNTRAILTANDQIAHLSERMAEVENRGNQQQEIIIALQSALSEERSNTTGLTSEVAKLKSEVAKLTSEVAKLKSKALQHPIVKLNFDSPQLLPQSPKGGKQSPIGGKQSPKGGKQSPIGGKQSPKGGIFPGQQQQSDNTSLFNSPPYKRF